MAKPNNLLESAVTLPEFTVQNTMLPVEATGAMLKSPETPTGAAGDAELTPRIVTVTGWPAALLARPVPDAGAAGPPAATGIPAQISFGRYQEGAEPLVFSLYDVYATRSFFSTGEWMRISRRSIPAGAMTRKRGRSQLAGNMAPSLPLAESC